MSAIKWRVEAMRAQIPAAGGIPFLVAVPDIPGAAGVCLSCGDPIELVGYVQRCRLCTCAATRVLMTPAGNIAQPAPLAAA